MSILLKVIVALLLISPVYGSENFGLRRLHNDILTRTIDAYEVLNTSTASISNFRVVAGANAAFALLMQIRYDRTPTDEQRRQADVLIRMAEQEVVLIQGLVKELPTADNVKRIANLADASVQAAKALNRR